jgi:hypothetical protein
MQSVETEAKQSHLTIGLKFYEEEIAHLHDLLSKSHQVQVSSQPALLAMTNRLRLAYGENLLHRTRY